MNVNRALEMIDYDHMQSSLDDMRLAKALIERNHKMIVDYPSLESLLIKLNWIIEERETDIKKKNYE